VNGLQRITPIKSNEIKNEEILEKKKKIFQRLIYPKSKEKVGNGF
jgi:hypothetical protein